MSLHSLGIPDLPERAFMRDARGHIMPQGKGSKPSTPNYEQLAREQAAGNLEMAKYAAQANRVNQVTPWGSLTWSNDRTFDQAGYDAAMAAYQQSLQQPGAQPQGQQYNVLGFPVSNWGSMTVYDGSNTDLRDSRQISVEGMGGNSRGGALTAPNRDDFWIGGDNWTQTVQLSPEMQALLNQQMALEQGLFGAQDAALGRVNQAMANPFDISSLPDGGSVYDPNLATNNATELLMQRLNPELDRQAQSLQAQLANQGITQGSAAYARAMNQFGQQRNDAATQAALQGITLGMQQQGMQFGQSEQARNRALQEQAYLRSLPLNELNALRTGTQVQMPQFPSYAQQAVTGGPDLVGAANNTYNSQMQAYNAQQAGGAGLMGGLLGLGSLGLGAYSAGLFGASPGLLGGSLGSASSFSPISPMYTMSDRRLKRDVKRVGTADNGLGIYSYQYVWGGPTQIGYMADEVERIAPHAVAEIGGYKAVNYGGI